MSNRTEENELKLSALEGFEGEELNPYRAKQAHDDASPTTVVDGRVTGFDGAPGIPGIEFPLGMEEATTDSLSPQAEPDNEYLNKTSSGRSLMSFGFQSTASGLTSWVGRKLKKASFRSGMSWSTFSFSTLPPVDTEQQQEPPQPIGLCVSIDQEQRTELLENSRNILLSNTTLDSTLDHSYVSTACENLDGSMSSLGIRESNRAMEIEVDDGPQMLALTTVPYMADMNKNRAIESEVVDGANISATTSVPYTDADVLGGQGGEGKYGAQPRSFLFACVPV